MNQQALHILNKLRLASGPVSGEELCQELGISRTAVWKHIKSWRLLGYEIASATKRGYELRQVPDTPFPWEMQRHLTTAELGRQLHWLDTIDSTNRHAAQLATAGEPAGTVVVADTQTGGRGRLQRAWFSPPACNLYFSLILRPQVAPEKASQVALLAALALVEAVLTCAPEIEARIKWPNDLYIKRRKCAGILCEMSSELDRVHHLIVGLGININVLPGQFPAEISAIATSLRAQSDHAIERVRVLATFLNTFEGIYSRWLEQGLEPFLPRLLERSLLLGRDVTINTAGATIQGIVTGFSPTGSLLLLDPEGHEREIHSGDVHIQKF